MVVGEGDLRPRNAFALVLFLLELENVHVEELLQALVCKVDAKLLKGVIGKVFKAENVLSRQSYLCVSERTKMPMERSNFGLSILEFKLLTSQPNCQPYSALANASRDSED